MSNNKEQKALEKLLLSEDLEELNNFTGTFNIFNALKLQNNEIRHSNFLSWLMSPYESHKIGDYFLKEFLKSAIKEYSLDEKVSLDLKDIVFFNLDDVEIRREYKNIDLLIISPQNSFICIIENKIWSCEHASTEYDSQLIKYADIVDKEFSNYENKLYIYLAPNIESCDLIERKTKGNETAYYYIPMTYEQIHKSIDKTLRFKADNMSYDVRIFIEHYKKMIERNIMGNTDKNIVELCRKIYRENKTAIDLIIENNDYKSDIFEAMTELIKNRSDLQEINFENNSILALPSDLNNINQFKYGKWTNDLILYIHFINFIQGHKDACVELLIAPPKDDKDNEKKLKLISNIEEKTGLKFKKTRDDWHFSQAFSIITREECLNCDNYDDIKAHIENKLEELKTIYIDNLRIALNEIN